MADACRAATMVAGQRGIAARLCRVQLRRAAGAVPAEDGGTVIVQPTQEPDPPREPPDGAVLEASSLTKRSRSITALDGLTVSVRAGITGLVGANGAGKSTL